MVNKQGIKTNFWWIIAIIGYYCWFQAFYNAVRFGNMFYYSDFYDLVEGVCYNFPPILILFLLNIQIVFRLFRFLPIKTKIVVDVCCSFVATILVNYLYLLVFSLFKEAVVDWSGSLLNDIIILLGVETVYYFTNLLRSHQEIEEANRRTLQYKYDALKAQINPHFLFNSLNILHSLVSLDTSKSKVFIRELAKMYRYIMAQHNRNIVSVGEELDFLNSYISVLEMRYNNKFFVEMKGEKAIDKSMIPFTMQLLIENVTKHNEISARCPMKVSIEFFPDKIIIANAMVPKPAESVKSIGLSYLTQLYAIHGHTFHTESDGKTFKAYVPLISTDKYEVCHN